RVASGAASSVAPHRVWAASSVELAGVSRPPKPPNSTLDVPGRSGATPRWGHAAVGPRRGGTGRAAVGPRRGGTGPVAAGRGGPGHSRPGSGRAGAQPAWLRRVWLRSGRPGSCETVLPHLSEQRSDLRVPCGVALQELATQHGGAHQRVGRETLPGGLARTGH